MFWNRFERIPFARDIANRLARDSIEIPALWAVPKQKTIHRRLAPLLKLQGVKTNGFYTDKGFEIHL